MVTLYELARRTEVGDRIRWRGEDTDVWKPKPRTEIETEEEDTRIAVTAEGPRGGVAGFSVHENGESRAWYGQSEEDMGPVDRAELVDEDLFTKPWGDNP